MRETHLETMSFNRRPVETRLETQLLSDWWRNQGRLLAGDHLGTVLGMMTSRAPAEGLPRTNPTDAFYWFMGGHASALSPCAPLFHNTRVHAQVLIHVQVFITPWTVALQDPLTMEFPRQQCWSGFPFPTSGDLPDPGMESPPLVFLQWQAILFHCAT